MRVHLASSPRARDGIGVPESPSGLGGWLASSGSEVEVHELLSAVSLHGATHRPAEHQCFSDRGGLLNITLSARL